MKKSDIVELQKVLEDLLSQKSTKARTVYKFLKLRKELEPEYLPIKETIDRTQELIKEYLERRDALAIQHAKKENGRPVIEDGKVILENPEEYYTELKKLEEEYKEQLTQYSSAMDELQAELENEIEISFSEKLTPEELEGFSICGKGMEILINCGIIE